MLMAPFGAGTPPWRESGSQDRETSPFTTAPSFKYCRSEERSLRRRRRRRHRRRHRKDFGYHTQGRSAGLQQEREEERRSARVSERERRLEFLQSSLPNHGNNQHSPRRRRRRISQSRRVDRAQKTTPPCARRGAWKHAIARTGRRGAKRRSRVVPSCKRWR